jgi:serine/threonine protein kinase
MKPLSNLSIQKFQKMISDPDLSGTKYTLIKKIGSGGMAEVYLVFDTEIKREAAMKVLHPAGGDDFSERMIREAKVIAKLEHPSIVPVHDLGVLLDGRNFYVMKYVQGESLNSFASRVSLTERLAIFQKICDAVSFAHSRKVLHRDLKPQNIMVGSFGEVQVMDWGLAKLLDDVSLEIDGKAVMGTPEYMSPEQQRGSTTLLDERTDIYSLGAILRELIPPGRPKRLIAVCLKAMAQSPADRYASAEELSRDISAYVNGLPMIAYRENVFEKMMRWISKNSFVVLLVLAYLIMRAILYFVL